jgi:hypothetical protein
VDDAEAARQVSLLLEQEAEAEVEEQDQPKKKTTKRERKEMEDAIDFLLAAQKEWEAMQGENRKQMVGLLFWVVLISRLSPRARTLFFGRSARRGLRGRTR